MKELTVVYAVSFATLACIFISACSTGVEQRQPRNSPQHSISVSTPSSAALKMDYTEQETALLQYASPDINASSETETYVF